MGEVYCGHVGFRVPNLFLSSLWGNVVAYQRALWLVRSINMMELYPAFLQRVQVVGLESHIPPCKHGASDRALQSSSLQSCPKGGGEEG